MEKKNTTSKIARWALALEEFDVEVQHRPGTTMHHVDALSRNFVMIVEDGLLTRIKAAQAEDKECKMVAQLIEKGHRGDYVLRAGVIYKMKNGNFLLKIPQAMVKEIMCYQ